MRTRIKSRKVSSSPAWLKQYQPAHTATADQIVQRYINNELMLVPKSNRSAELKKFITKKVVTQY